MGLVPGLDFTVFGSARYAHRLNPDSKKQADSSLDPFVNDGWPSIVIEAGWSESLGRDASWWLTAESAPNNPKHMLLITFLRQARTFRMERYELRQTTRTAPTGAREVPTLIEAVDIDLRSTPPTITGAPPFRGIMRRDPVGQEGNISLDAAYLGTWALRMAAANNL
jgi:hypothetical protein